MDFERTRPKTIPVNNQIKPNAPQYVEGLNLDNNLLSMICKLIVTDSQYLKRSQLIQVQNFLNLVNPDQYNKDPEKASFMSFIKKGLEARLQFNLNDPAMVIRHINGGMLDDGIVDVNTFKGLDQASINWLGNMISTTLKYSYMYNRIDEMLDICTRFKSSSYDHKEDIVKEFESAINNTQNDFRRSRHEDFNETMFSLKDESFITAVTDTYNQLANPRRKLRTGMQGLNELLGGGFESGRLYVFFGLPGEGKSSTLLDLMYQLKRYNNDYKTKDPTKTPCIVMLTMENTIVESIERLFGMACIRNNSMTDYSLEEVMRMLREEGELRLDMGSPIDLVIKYKPTNSVDTTYLYTLVDDLEDQGMECIALFQDYIGRIRSTERYSDTRLEYGCVTDEFKTFAENKDIPVITASQLNRDASKHIDEGRKSNKSDLVRFIGRSNISESMLILNNIDAGFMIAPEITQEGEKFLGVQRIKIRYKASDREYVYLPYMKNTLRLIEDFGREATYRTTMRTESEIFSRPNTSIYQVNSISDLDTIQNHREEVEFGSARVVNSNFENLEDNYEAAAKHEINSVIWSPVIFYNKEEGQSWSPIIFEEPKVWNPITFYK